MAMHGDDRLITIQQHIISQQRNHPTASGEFSWLLSGITLAACIIQAKVRRAGLLDVLGDAQSANVHGESQQKLDVIANETVERCLGFRGNVAILGSEEVEEPKIVAGPYGGGKYIVLFDPLDGSSNIDVNVSVGTIFSIFQRPHSGPISNVHEEVLQAGSLQLAAGYVVYGSSTVMCYTTGNGVHMFTLEPSIGSFMLHSENVRMPDRGSLYSVNEANSDAFPKGIQQWLTWAKTKPAGPYSSRYIGSLVADFHRNLLRGGVFLYPRTAKDPKGKLRLMYEANPIAFIAEQAGGMATDGTQRILDKQPIALHERTPLIVGSRQEVTQIMEYLLRNGE